jgi:putative hydrolase of the HAD superfamily
MKVANLKAVIFDLDDTLYEERLFFLSGFAVVADFLEKRGVGANAFTVALLNNYHHSEGRQQVFQKLAARLGFPVEWLPEMVTMFRSHRPVISLTADAREVLSYLRLTCHLRLGCVTDGWSAVQRRKIEALAVEPLLDAVVIADEFGREFWKPHPKPFHVCCARLDVEPGEAVFVGDNPERDMVGAHRAGLTSIRIRRPDGYFATTEYSVAETRPDLEIEQLTELMPLFAV